MGKYYSKVLRKAEDNYYIFKNFSLNKNNSQFKEYAKWLKNYKEQNYSQIIINSTLMLKIIKKASYNNFILKDIEFEKGYKNEDYNKLKEILLNIEQDIKFIFKLEEYLNNIVDKNSIIINKLIFNFEYNKQYSKIEINDNGIIISDAEQLNDNFFNTILYPILQEKYNNK